MRTHTTYTDLRRIMKLHDNGESTQQISDQVFIEKKEVEKVIAARTPKPRALKKSKTPATTE